MAVPDTTNFSLQDVVDEINPTTDDLQDCINDATASSYDPAYYTAPATSLLEFRNYGASSLTVMYITSISYTTSAGACGQTVTELVYHNGAGTFPTTNDTVYTDSGGTTVFVGDGDHYGQDTADNDPATTTSQIASNGRVSNPLVCI